MPLAVELAGVSFGYRPGQHVLEGVDLSLGEGEFVAVAGPNGGGKTTLVRLLLGLERPSEGEALLYGEPAHRFSRRRTLGYLAQRSVLGGAVEPLRHPITIKGAARPITPAARNARSKRPATIRYPAKTGPTA